jgi:chemotaxis protein CheX
MELNTKQIFENFSKATILTLKQLCKTDAKELPSFIKSTSPNFIFDVAGLIGVTSETAKGSIGIYFPKAVFLKLVSRMFDENVVTIDRTNEDAAAEMMNIIFGNAKIALNEQGHNFKVSIPTVLRGGNVAAPSSAQHEVNVFPFQMDAGEFYLEFTLVPLKASEKATKSTKSVTFNTAAKAAFFKPFVDATIATLQTMCSFKATTGTPSSKKSSEAFSFDLAGIIGITSENLTGSYMLSFKKDVFLNVMSKMLGETFTELQPGMEDGVAELLNIILGQAKTILNDQHGHSIQMALPTLVHGDSIRSNTHPGKTTIVIPFYSEVGRFIVEVTID